MTEIDVLDYPSAKILMHVDTPYEKSMRIVACAKEPYTTNMIDALDPKADVFWDIGANVGSYTLIAATRGVTTVAVEPVLENLRTLKNNLCLNDLLGRVVIVPMALGSGAGIQWLGYRLGSMASGAASHLMGTPKELFAHRMEITHQQPILTLPLDGLVEAFKLPAPTHIKLDVDGGELDVLAGAERQLAGPTLKAMMVELSPEREHPIVDWLAARGWGMAEQWRARGTSYGRFEPVVPVVAKKGRKKVA